MQMRILKRAIAAILLIILLCALYIAHQGQSPLDPSTRSPPSAVEKSTADVLDWAGIHTDWGDRVYLRWLVGELRDINEEVCRREVNPPISTNSSHEDLVRALFLDLQERSEEECQ
jgi:hypothetical protein